MPEMTIHRASAGIDTISESPNAAWVSDQDPQERARVAPIDQGAAFCSSTETPSASLQDLIPPESTLQILRMANALQVQEDLAEARVAVGHDLSLEPALLLPALRQQAELLGISPRCLDKAVEALAVPPGQQRADAVTTGARISEDARREHGTRSYHESLTAGLQPLTLASSGSQLKWYGTLLDSFHSNLYLIHPPEIVGAKLSWLPTMFWNKDKLLHLYADATHAALHIETPEVLFLCRDVLQALRCAMPGYRQEVELNYTPGT